MLKWFKTLFFGPEPRPVTEPVTPMPPPVPAPVIEEPMVTAAPAETKAQPKKTETKHSTTRGRPKKNG
jgi:hypothetical protein